MSRAQVCTASNVRLLVDGVELPPVAIGSALAGEQMAAPGEIARAHARWTSGVVEQLAKFTGLTTLTGIHLHGYFVENLLCTVARMGLGGEAVAGLRWQLFEAIGAARRRLIPRWQEMLPLFGAAFFAVTEDELAKMPAIMQGSAL